MLKFRQDLPKLPDLSLNLPRNTDKHDSTFHDYRDELMDLLRQHGKEAIAAIA